MEKLISCCGLNCVSCDARIATLTNDDELRRQTAEKWRVMYNSPDITPEMINCTGCRAEGSKIGHWSMCGMRKCASSKNFTTCGQCDTLQSCDIINPILQLAPDALENLKPFKTIKSHPGIIALIMLIAALAMLGSCKKSSSGEQAVTTGESFRFVWLADSRGDSLKHPVHTEVLNPIINAIDTLSPQPSFVIFGGDGSYRGYIKPSYTFQAFKDLFLPITSKGIPFYAVIGNHELYYEHSDSGFMLGNQKQFQTVFSENPANGPAGYEHLAYSFTSPGGSCLFVALDAYYLTHDSIPASLGGNIDAAQMSWLQALVAQSKATHKFAFIHTPYYYISNDTSEPSIPNQTYTALWALLDVNKFDMYACGHSHLYARRTIDSTVLPNPQTTPHTAPWKNNVVQLINGTCGAGPDAGTIDPAIKTAWDVHNDQKTYYFSVIDIAGHTVTVTSYSGYTGAYTMFEKFTITR